MAKGSLEQPARPTPAETDPEWAEGNPKLRKHLRRERAAGLSAAKKAEFRRLHGGKLFCQKCSLEPSVSYGDDGDACIEVHHSKVLVSQMEKGHVTKLEDLECLCANCHRVEHRKLRKAAAAAAASPATS